MKAMTDEQKKLAGDNYGLALAASRQLSGLHRGMSYDDLLSACGEGLCRAASKYDPSKGTEFSTYAWIWMRRFSKLGADSLGVISVPERLRAEGGSSDVGARAASAKLCKSVARSDGALSGLRSREPEVGNEAESRDEVERIMRFMTPIQRTVVASLIEGKTRVDIGKSMDCSRQNIRRIVNTAREPAKRAMRATE